MIKFLKESEKKKKMNSYKTFAQFYDELTDNVDYKVRSDYISNFFSRYSNGGNKVIDLACGTGTMTALLCEKGYDVTGVDLSCDMLAVASSKCDAGFICADISNFNINKKFDYCICLLDSINHLNGIDDVNACFNCVYDSLNEDGLFIFDVNTMYKHNNILADNTFVFDNDGYFLSWDNEQMEDNVIRILLDFFVYNGKNYDRYSEEFFEKAYEIDELKSMLKNFEIIGIYDELTENPPKADSERVFFVCKKVK